MYFKTHIVVLSQVCCMHKQNVFAVDYLLYDFKQQEISLLKGSLRPCHKPLEKEWMSSPRLFVFVFSVCTLKAPLYAVLENSQCIKPWLFCLSH